ncbi:tetratricopeptide repeat protein [candidate division KSB1 bacterium]|nr:tetratricopeptide repeat protein [candidate division KSB1 bacterium]
MARFRYLGLFIILILIVAGCDREGENIPTSAPTSDIYLDSGWEYYSAGDYAEALDAFAASKSRDAIKEDAYNGLGWTYAKLHDYDQSISNFLLLLSLTDNDAVKADVYAGLAMTYGAKQLVTPIEETALREELGTSAIQYARQVLQAAPNYVFSRDNRVTVTTLHALVAQCYFSMQDFINALREVDTHLESGYRQSLVTNSVISMQSDTVTAVVTPATELNGVVDATIDGQIVEVLSVKNSVTNVAYTILDFDQGGSNVTFVGNPIPVKEDYFIIDFQGAVDYNLFLNNLLATIIKYQ